MTNKTKNAVSLKRKTKHGFALIWEDAEETWEDSDDTWGDLVDIIYTNKTKNLVNLTNKVKN